jgi:hypothetical protein
MANFHFTQNTGNLRSSSRSRPTAQLPRGAPTEVAALGPPEQVHAADEDQFRRNVILLRLLCACAGLMCFAVAGFFGYVLKHPFGDSPPPEEVSLGIAVGSGILGLLFLGVAILFRGSCASRTYLVYDAVLVELDSGGHRIIPWEKIGERQQGSPFVVSYCFPVQGGKALAFDNTLHQAGLLCQTIQDRTASRGVQRGFDPRADLTEMAAATPGAFVMALRFGGNKEVFRITILGDRLLFYRVAASAGYFVNSSSQAGGLWGGSPTPQRQRFLDEMQRLEHADAPTLIRFAAENEGSFVLSAADFDEITIDPPSFLKNFLHGLDGVRPECLVNIKLAHEKPILLAVLSRQGVLVAAEEFPRLFGAAVKVNIVWSHSSCAFVGKS